MPQSARLSAGGGSNGYLGNAQMNRDLISVGLPLMRHVKKTFIEPQGALGFCKIHSIWPHTYTVAVLPPYVKFLRGSEHETWLGQYLLHSIARLEKQKTG